MRLYAQGDHKAFEALYGRHKDSLYRYFCRQLNDVLVAQDLYQELWSRVIKSSQNYQASAKWITWAYRIAHNLIIDHLRVLKPVEQWDEEEHSGIESKAQSGLSEPDQSNEQWQMAEQLKRCIGQLPQAQQEVFLLNEEAGMTVKAMAEVINISSEAAKSRLRYAKTQLQTCLQRFWDSVSSADSTNKGGQK